MDFRKQTINGKLYNVVNYNDFNNNRELYDNSQTAIDIDIENEKYILPLRSKNDDRPGIYKEGCMFKFVLPVESTRNEYSSENTINFSNCKDIAEIMEKQEILKDEEKEILANPDNIFIPPISGKESPAMLGLKQAIIEKHIDIDKYQDRFGKENFPNDKRKFKDNDITMFMMNRINKALDIKATLILEDKNPDVPNPIGKRITIDLTGYDDE